MNTNISRCETTSDSLSSAPDRQHIFLLPSSVEVASDHPSHNPDSSELFPQFNHRSKRLWLCGRLKRLLTSTNKSPGVIVSQTQTQLPPLGHVPSATLPLSATLSSLRAENQHSSPTIYDEPISQPTRRQLTFDRSRTKCLCWRHCTRLFCKSIGCVMGRRMPNENLFVLSMIQVLCGLAAVILSGVAVTKLVFLYQMATGLWSGFLMLATGFHGILTSRRCSPRTLISLLIFCILVALAACLLSCVSVAGLIEDGLLRPDSSLSILNTQPYFEAIRLPTGVETNTFRVKFPSRSSPSIHILETQPSRLHQVMLHVLLLVIGILEASVSVACAVLCCRQICPSSNSPPLSAISYLQTRGATLVPGGAECLLAVAAGPNQPLSPLLDYSIPPPEFHASAQSFLPRPGRQSFILTQAETGIHALVAAQTIAGLISPSESEMQAQSTEISPSTSSAGLAGRNRRREKQRAIIARRKADAVRLNSRLSSLLPQLTCNTTNNGLRNRSSLLYVLSSPSADEPPMIFPPFPPAYHCDGSPTPAYFAQQMQPHTFNIDPYLSLSQRTPTITEETRGENTLPIGTQMIHNHSPPPLPRRPSSLFSQLRPRRSRNSRRRSNAAVTLVGDRILQPVLIVEDSPGSATGTESQHLEQPPSYTTIVGQSSYNNPEGC